MYRSDVLRPIGILDIIMTIRPLGAKKQEVGVELPQEATQTTVAATNQTTTFKVSDPEKAAQVVARYQGEEAVGIGSLLNKVIEQALNQKASDVHIEPRETDVLIRYRIDGILRDIITIDKKLEEALIFKIKVSSKLRTDEHFAPQDGRIQFIFNDGRKLDTRVSILPTSNGEKVVMRLLTQEGRSFSLADLGFGKKELEVLEKNYIKPYGMIIVSGPTGSGKTTTLYSILKIINSREINITTIEDPVEYSMEGINHIQINPKAGLTFATGLRSILRQDPDVVMVGEIRDNETARIAINAALTGHLVLSTIHTNDSVTSIPRFIDMGIEPYLVASTINLVIAQRLARKLCTECKRLETITSEEYEKVLKFRPDIAKFIKKGHKFYKEVGCKVCNDTGFKGRIGLYEVLEMTEDLRKIVLEKVGTDVIFKAAREHGLILILEDGINKMNNGIISLSELMRVTALRE